MASLTKCLCIITVFGHAMTAPTGLNLKSPQILESRGSSINEYIVREGAVVAMNRQSKRNEDSVIELIVKEGNVVSRGANTMVINEAIIRAGEAFVMEED